MDTRFHYFNENQVTDMYSYESILKILFKNSIVEDSPFIMKTS